MGDEEITYTTVRFHKSSESQNPGKTDKMQGPREAGNRIVQCRQEQQELNLSQRNTTTQNNNRLNETLRNKYTECDDLKHQKKPDSSTENRTDAVRKLRRFEVQLAANNAGKHVEGHLLCCGIKCYYFIMDDKHWSECKQTCQDCSLSILKIENEDELVS
ncbi:hypothetical protein STEG23_017849 [Scotinomys teguina]